MEVLFLVGFILVVVIVSILFYFRQDKPVEVRKNSDVSKKLLENDPLFASYYRILKEALDRKHVECADMAFLNLIHVVENENFKYEGEFSELIKKLRTDYSIFRQVQKIKIYQPENIVCQKSCKTTDLHKEFNESAKMLSATAKEKMKQNGSIAVKLQVEAINLKLEKKISDSIKLARYYYHADEKQKSLSLLTQLLRNYNTSDIYVFHKDLSEIYEELSTINYNEKAYFEFIYNHCLSVYHLSMSFVCKGKEADLMFFLSSPNKLINHSSSKINVAFKKLNKSENQKKFEKLFSAYFNVRKKKFSNLAIKSSNVLQNSKYVRHTDKSMNRNSQILKNCSEFIEEYNVLCSHRFDVYFHENLAGLIK
jgi:hypothetical protein